MLTEYTEKIDKTFSELRRIQTKIDTMLNSKDSIKLLDDVKVYKNYALIFAYGCIENITKNLIADYYKKEDMPLRCQNFAASLFSDNYSLSINKEKFHKFLQKECSKQWFDEIKRRERLHLLDKKYNKYTLSQMYASLDIIFSERCKFAHGESSYEGTISEFIDNFERAISWLYEIDDIINDKQLKG